MLTRCLVIGSARNWEEDVNAACELAEFNHFVLVKRTGIIWPHKIDAWVSLHGDTIQAMYKQRLANGFSEPERIYCWEKTARSKCVTHSGGFLFPGQTVSASSGIYGVKVALFDLKFDRVVMCGIPMDPKMGRFDHKDDWKHSRAFFKGFLQTLPHMKEKVRSMSGLTKQHLGAPTIEWLTGMPYTGATE